MAHNKPAPTNLYVISGFHCYPSTWHALIFHIGAQGQISMWSWQPSWWAGASKGHFQAERLQRLTDSHGSQSSLKVSVPNRKPGSVTSLPYFRSAFIHTVFPGTSIHLTSCWGK
jgi:hypothetical protein